MVHDGHAARHSKQMGGFAMTRRRITAVVASLFVGLLLMVNAPVISAADINGGGSAPIISADNGCDAAYTLTVDECVQWAASHATVAVASVGAPVAVPTGDTRFIENNTIMFPSVESETSAATVPSYWTIDGATYYDQLTGRGTTSCDWVPAPCEIP
jgi:hypothetical protein